jgi:hypothetical protein
MEAAMKALVCILIATAWISPLGAQDSTRATPDSAVPAATHLYRSPRRALILGSLIPGAGHIYSGEYFKGVSNYVGTIFTIGGGALIYVLDDCALALFSACKPGPQWPSRIFGAVAIGAGVWTWISSARDAPRAAERANVKHSRKSAAVKPIIDAPVWPHGDWRVGVEIPW